MQKYPPAVNAIGHSLPELNTQAQRKPKLDSYVIPCTKFSMGVLSTNGKAEEQASRKQHENSPINISSARCKTVSIKGNIDKMTFY